MVKFYDGRDYLEALYKKARGSDSEVDYDSAVGLADWFFFEEPRDVYYYVSSSCDCEVLGVQSLDDPLFEVVIFEGPRRPGRRVGLGPDGVQMWF